MTNVTVQHEDGDRFQVVVRGHRLVIDQPEADGGTDAGPTPTELFVAGLASCVGFYAERFLRRHGLPVEDLRVECSYEFAVDRPARVGSVSLAVHAPGLSPSKREAFLAVVEHCTVHNSIRSAPDVRIELDPADLVA